MNFDPRSVPVRFSNLKAMGRSARHYRHAIECGREDSVSMRLGRMVHWGVLGCMPDDEDGRIAVYDGDRRGKAWTEFEAAHAGDEIVTAREMVKAKPIIDAVNADDIATLYLVGEKERRIDWEIGGRRCRSRLDVVRPGVCLSDLKTTTNARPDEFKRLAWRMNYHAQMAMYVDAANFAGLDIKTAYLVGVEVRAPHVVTVLELSGAALEHGRRTYRGWFENLIVCEASNQWPGYVQAPVLFDVPEWFAEESSEEEDASA